MGDANRAGSTTPSVEPRGKLAAPSVSTPYTLHPKPPNTEEPGFLGRLGAGALEAVRQSVGLFQTLLGALASPFAPGKAAGSVCSRITVRQVFFTGFEALPLISAIGASLFLQYTMRGFFGPGLYAYPTIQALQEPVPIDFLSLRWEDVLVVASALAMMVGLMLYVNRTKMGTAIRAVSEDPATAALMGIDVNRVIVTTFAIGAALAGAAGVLYGLLFTQIYYTSGIFPGLKAFTAAVLGGIGLIGVLPALFAVVASLGLVAPNATTLALAGTRAAGSAAALLGVLQLTIGALVSPLAGLGGATTALPMAGFIGAFGVAALVTFGALCRPGPAQANSSSQ